MFSLADNVNFFLIDFESMASKKKSSDAEGNVHMMVKRISSRTDSNMSPKLLPKNPQKVSSSNASTKSELQELVADLGVTIKEMGATLRELKKRVDTM